MFLKNTVEITNKYSGSSKFDFWKDLKIGDKLEISTPFASPGFGRQRYSHKVNFKNLTQGTEFNCDFIEGTKYLTKLEYKEL